MSPYLFGGVDWASLTITLDDVDRIEVLRGSNSATYGANAFLGVANIVTRTAAQSAGARAEVSAGNNGIFDASVRVASDYKSLRWRLSAGSRRDDGLENTVDNNSKVFADLGVEVQLSASAELSLAAGVTRGDYGIGYESNVGNPPRTGRLDSKYGLLRWRRSLSPTHEISVTYSRTEDNGADRYEIPVTPTHRWSSTTHAAPRATAWTTSSTSMARNWRVSWGAQYQRETLWAPQLVSTSAVTPMPPHYRPGPAPAQRLPAPGGVRPGLAAGPLAVDSGLTVNASPRRTGRSSRPTRGRLWAHVSGFPITRSV